MFDRPGGHAHHAIRNRLAPLDGPQPGGHPHLANGDGLVVASAVRGDTSPRSLPSARLFLDGWEIAGLARDESQVRGVIGVPPRRPRAAGRGQCYGASSGASGVAWFSAGAPYAAVKIRKPLLVTISLPTACHPPRAACASPLSSDW